MACGWAECSAQQLASKLRLPTENPSIYLHPPLLPDPVLPLQNPKSQQDDVYVVFSRRKRRNVAQQKIMGSTFSEATKKRERTVEERKDVPLSHDESRLWEDWSTVIVRPRSSRGFQMCPQKVAFIFSASNA